MNVWSVVKWVLIAVAVWWAWNWITNNFVDNSGAGTAELYNAPYAAPLVGNSPVTVWSPYWYGPPRARGWRRPRPMGGKR